MGQLEVHEKHRQAISMFCFTVMTPGSYEGALVLWQREQKVGIFACEEAGIYSNKSFTLAPGLDTVLVKHELRCKPGDGGDWSFNSWMFIAIWKSVVTHGRWQYHDWTAKVDPDAVFFPDRLRPLLMEHHGSAFVTNCRVGVHGAVQVLGRMPLAILAEDYAKSWDGMSPARCIADVPIIEYGNCTRDTFLDACLVKVLLAVPLAGPSRTTDQRLACQADCDCNLQESQHCRGFSASFYPHRTVEDYQRCMDSSVAHAVGRTQ